MTEARTPNKELRRSVGNVVPGGPRRGGRMGSGERLKHVAEFMRQLAVLVGTGTPLVDAIESLERQAKQGVWKQVLTDLRVRTEEGSQLSDAMAAHPDCFDGVCRSLVMAGEQGGKLEVLLDRLSSLTRQQMRVRSAVVGALTYPIVLIGVALAVMIALIGFVMPRFEGLFKTLNTPLPPTTKVLMTLGDFVREHWLLTILGLGAAIGGVVWWIRSEQGRETIGRAMVTLPGVGPCTRSIITARLSRVLGVLLDGHVPLLEAIRLARDSTGHALYARVMERAEEALTRGEPLASELERSPLFSASVCEAVRSGEKSGQLGQVMMTLANYMDEDNEVTLRSLTRLVEPVILVVLGLVVGTIAISMFLPLFDLTAAAGGGG